MGQKYRNCAGRPVGRATRTLGMRFFWACFDHPPPFAEIACGVKSRPLKHSGATMGIDVQKPLFAWQCLEDHPALVTVRRLLECIPDGRLLESLRAARGRGRNDYPVRVLWRVVLLSILLRHKDVEACLGELQRNPTLQEIVGTESTEQIPHGWNVSRFLETLGQEPHRSLLQEVFRVMVQRLGLAVPDLGQHTAGDSTWLNARRPRADAREQKEQAERQAAARNTPAKTDKSAGSWSGSASSCICLSIRATKSPWRTRSARRKPATTKCCRAWWTKPWATSPRRASRRWLTTRRPPAARGDAGQDPSESDRQSHRGANPRRGKRSAAAASAEAATFQREAIAFVPLKHTGEQEQTANGRPSSAGAPASVSASACLNRQARAIEFADVACAGTAPRGDSRRRAGVAVAPGSVPARARRARSRPLCRSRPSGTFAAQAVPAKPPLFPAEIRPIFTPCDARPPFPALLQRLGLGFNPWESVSSVVASLGI
jgi:hypothetical protein